MPTPADQLDADPALDGPDGVRYEHAPCAVCGAAENRLVVQASSLIYDRSGTARIVRCCSCGQLYQDPRPTRDTIARCYPATYGPHVEQAPVSAAVATQGSPEKTPWYLSAFTRGIPGLRRLYYWLSDPYSELLPPLPQSGARALEFGCGAGRYLERLVAAGWQAEGLEPAEDPARRCRERGLNVQAGTFESVDFPEHSFDLVVAWMVLEHLHDPGAALDKIRRLLRPSGTFLFSVPNIACWEPRVFGRYYFIFNEPTHLHHFSPPTLQRLLAQHGFPINRIYFQHNLYNVVGSLGLWLQHVLPRRRLGSRLLAFCDDPGMWGRLWMAPAAKLLAALHQTGRMTVVAREGER